MKDDDKIDFGALDPSRDRDRWEGLVGHVVARATARRRRPTLGGEIRAWGRPALALAAVLALVVWLAGSWRGESTVARQPAASLSEWAMNDEVPSATTILEVLGDDDGTH